MFVLCDPNNNDNKNKGVENNILIHSHYQNMSRRRNNWDRWKTRSHSLPQTL